MSNHEECAKVCNSLLRGELSAVETYSQAVEKFEGDPSQAELVRIRSEHDQSASTLRQHLLSMGAEPSDSSGPWGAFAQAVEGVATLLGESPALAILKEGEEHGAGEYRDALENSGVMEDIKNEIRSTLLPRLENHIATLQDLQTK